MILAAWIIFMCGFLAGAWAAWLVGAILEEGNEQNIRSHNRFH